MKAASRLAPYLFPLGLILGLLIGCDGSGGSDSAVIGPNGGVVRSADGDLTLTIPAGALASAQRISATLTSVSARDSDDREVVYRLEPDGLVFAAPVDVSYNLGVSPVVDGTIQGTGLESSMSSVSGGVSEALSNQGVFLDISADRTLLVGKLSHFSDLLIETTLTRKDRTGVLFDRIPDTLAVDASFNADVAILHPAKSRLSSRSVTHNDRSAAPVSYVGESDPVELGSLTSGQNVTLERSFPYKCSAAGSGTYLVTIDFLGSGQGGADKFVAAAKIIECVAAAGQPTATATTATATPPSGGVDPTATPSIDPTPVPFDPTATPEPTIAPTAVSATGCSVLGGTYSSQSGTCGLGEPLDPSVSGTQVLFDTLGANSNVIFEIDGASASSVSSNLIILGASGHDCRLRGCGSNGFEVFCQNSSGGSCSQSFRR